MAGAVSLSRVRDDVREDARYADQMARQDAQLARQAELDARAASREDRMADSQSLDDEVKRYEFEKTKTLDENAKRMKIETDRQAIEANKELFAIDTADEEAPLKLAEWGAKYFRVLDEKTGDPRLIRQFQINQGRVEARQILKTKAEELRAKREQEMAGTVSIDDEGKQRISRQLKPGEADMMVWETKLKKAISDAGGEANMKPEQWAAFEASKPKPAPVQAAPAVQERIKVNPQTGERIVLRGGKWQPL